MPLKGTFARRHLSVDVAAEPDPGIQKTHRIDGLAVQADLVMQMRPGRATGAAGAADCFPRRDRVADIDENGR